jgi:hypothetical protein
VLDEKIKSDIWKKLKGALLKFSADRRNFWRSPLEGFTCSYLTNIDEYLNLFPNIIQAKSMLVEEGSE